MANPTDEELVKRGMEIFEAVRTRLTLPPNECARNLPSAYTVAEIDRRFYPMRFGKFRLDARGYRVSFGRLEDAEAFCRNEQAQYITMYPSIADRRERRW